MTINLFSGNIQGTYHFQPLASSQNQPLQSMQDKSHQQLVMRETHSCVKEPQKHLSALSNVYCPHSEKAKSSCASPESQDVNLTLVLPRNPKTQIQIYGGGYVHESYYPIRAQLVLSILRALTIRLEKSCAGGAPTHFDNLLMEANAFLYGYEWRAEKRRKPRTTRQLIRALLRLEERLQKTTY
ncbi:hypothetical protein EC835_102440 [Providencia alcalifaciens]|uniref:Uncharacterized protein n=1 Tax=Providencia alcalifaciens TaxID=126385 RepID=A0A4R3NWA8_9GAMM|nr:hypothetical protein EC835_102440 [Providencia alcalifaciens]